MPRKPAAELHADGAGIDVELVMDHDDVVGRRPVGGDKLLDRAAGCVHVALRLGKHDVFAPIGRFARQRAAFGLPVADAQLAG